MRHKNIKTIQTPFDSMQPIAWKILEWKTEKIMHMSFWYGKWSWEAVVWRFPTELSIDDTFHRRITIEMISGLIKIEFLNFKKCLSPCSTAFDFCSPLNCAFSFLGCKFHAPAIFDFTKST